MSRLNDLVYDTNVGPTGSSLDRIRSLFHGSLKLLEKKGSPYQSGEASNCYWFTIGINYPFFNQVVIYNRDPEILEKAIGRFLHLNILHNVFFGWSRTCSCRNSQSKGICK